MEKQASALVPCIDVSSFLDDVSGEECDVLTPAQTKVINEFNEALQNVGFVVIKGYN